MGIVVVVPFSRYLGLLALFVAVLGAGVSQSVRAQTQMQSAVTPYPLTSGLPIVGDPRDARANNLVVLDSIVFVLGVGILGGILVWWGLRIYKEK